MNTTAPLQAFADALASYQTERDVGLALHQLAVATVGAKLFTMTADNPKGGYVRRVYSSDETAYPVLGTKPIVFDENYRKMTEERFVYVVNSVEAMRADFPDLDLIVSLGCGSAINMPIVAGGEMLGSVNLLDAEGFYTLERVEAAKLLVVPAIACFLILRSRFTI
ncbi:GAF domain-containing protein [Devosia sp.]|uniref:GAF domain-containing protein n=1 Tax=Devosia sp. TaxID=1871048 RepID=UPI003BAB679D